MGDTENLSPHPHLWVSLAPSSGEKVERPFSPASLFKRVGTPHQIHITWKEKKPCKTNIWVFFLPLKSSPVKAEMGSERERKKNNFELDKRKKSLNQQDKDDFC